MLSLGLPFVVRATPQELRGVHLGGEPEPAAGAGAGALGVSRDALLRALGNLTVAHGAVPYAKRYGQRGHASTVRAFVQAHMAGAAAAAGAAGATAPQYVFDARAVGARPAPFAPLVERLLSLAPAARGAHLRQFMLGPPGSGSHMHFHGRAVNLLAAGVKLWHFSPPACAHFSSAEAAPLFAALLGAAPPPPASAAARLAACHAALGAPPLRALQAPGDAVVVPEGWAHAVLNLGDVVAVAFE